MRHFLSALTACLLVVSFTGTAQETRDHGEADNITSIDGANNGTFTGTYTHQAGSAAPHPWFTFFASAGDTVTVDVDTSTWSNGSTTWFYEVFDDNAEVGDARGVDFSNFLAQFGQGSTTYTATFTAPSSSQYAIQLDSWLGGDGDWTVTISGAENPSPVSVPATGLWSLAALLLAMMTVAVFQLRRQS